jgi:hypothetical protein
VVVIASEPEAHVARTALEDALREAEESALAELTAVRELLALAVRAATAGDAQAAEEVTA